VSRYDAGAARLEIPLAQVQVSAAYTAGEHLDQDLSRRGRRHRPADLPNWVGVDRPGPFDSPDSHLLVHPPTFPEFPDLLQISYGRDISRSGKLGGHDDGW
jgi:hypothetical protein